MYLPVTSCSASRWDFRSSGAVYSVLGAHDLLPCSARRRRTRFRIALTGSELQNSLAWWLVWRRGTSTQDAELAVQLATAAVRDAPNNGPIWHTLGVAYYRAGRWEEARAALRKSDELCGPTAYIEFFLSMTHARSGNIGEARASYDRGCELLRSLGNPVAGNGVERKSAQPWGEIRVRGIDGIFLCFRKEAAELLGINTATE